MTSEDSVIYLTDRTACETDDKCGMRFWWNRIEGRRGIVPKKEAFALKIGREIHEDLATIAEMEDISAPEINKIIREITDPLTSDDKLHRETMEILYRRLGWIAAFALFVEPKIRRDFETVQIEGEIILDRDPLWIAVTPDRVLRHREGKYLVYREYKSTISAGPKWVSHWPYDIQIHIGLKAVEEELEEKVAYAQVMGLMKGDSRGDRLMHPYVWGYKNEKTSSWTHDYTKARAAEWHPAPVWDYPGGVVEWVQLLGEEVATSQFPHSAPVFLNERMLNDFVSRRIAREAEIALVKEDCRTNRDQRVIFFEPRTNQCRPAFGDPCPYLGCCWNAAMNENPIASGDFEERVPHHMLELTLGKEN